MSRVDLEWNGAAVEGTIALAAAAAIDEIMGKCVAETQATIPIRSQLLHDDTTFEPAGQDGPGVVSGLWGQFSAFYALAIEKDDRSLVPSGSDSWFDVDPSLYRLKRYPGVNYKNVGSLRRAADRYYPKLSSAIKRHWKRQRRRAVFPGNGRSRSRTSGTRTALYKIGKVTGDLGISGGFRNSIYRSASGLGDISAIRGGTVGARIQSRASGRVTGRFLGGRFNTGGPSSRIQQRSSGKLTGRALGRMRRR